ncbi:cytochrome b6-f complex subunit 6 [filamentous cyanobacterium CCP1]|nr:cytochrome b6-f complex subunit 6 [filamentous cyanobacterium CCP2]PSB66890.1 cytochrome b6-f complex subunit 6 [filamentous cyanobacterium CCP1]
MFGVISYVVLVGAAFAAAMGLYFGLRSAKLI